MPATKSVPGVDLFVEVEKLLKPFAKLFTVRTGMVKNKRDYSLVVKKPVEISHRVHEGLFFVGVIDQKGYVGFYFFPIYLQPELKEKLAPGLLKLLKGKTCFYVKKMTPDLRDDIKRALRVGLAFYKERGWL